MKRSLLLLAIIYRPL